MQMEGNSRSNVNALKGAGVGCARLNARMWVKMDANSEPSKYPFLVVVAGDDVYWNSFAFTAKCLN